MNNVYLLFKMDRIIRAFTDFSEAERGAIQLTKETFPNYDIDLYYMPIGAYPESPGIKHYGTYRNGKLLYKEKQAIF